MFCYCIRSVLSLILPSRTFVLTGNAKLYIIAGYYFHINTHSVVGFFFLTKRFCLAMQLVTRLNTRMNGTVISGSLVWFQYLLIFFLFTWGYPHFLIAKPVSYVMYTGCQNFAFTFFFYNFHTNWWDWFAFIHIVLFVFILIWIEIVAKWFSYVCFYLQHS